MSPGIRVARPCDRRDLYGSIFHRGVASNVTDVARPVRPADSFDGDRADPQTTHIDEDRSLAPGGACCYVDLYWLPVAAGTMSRLRMWSLALWEAIEAARARRPRATLYHAALKVGVHGNTTYTLELTPAFAGDAVIPAMSGPVGLPGADRFRMFRYEMRCLQAEVLPDEEWAVATLRVAADCASARRVLDLAPAVPDHTWGLRTRGTSEMWTSDSAISWLLAAAGINASGIPLPPGGRAPGWSAGLDVARRFRLPAGS